MQHLIADWGELMLALFCFFVAHMLPARPAVRQALVSALGRAPYMVLYSAASIALLIWVARAAARAPYVEFWPLDPGLVAVQAIGMALACVLLVFGLSTPNPLSLGRSDGFDPQAPGIAALVRHPVLWAALIWAGSHILVNGDLAHVVVFGAFALLAVAGMAALDRRARRRLGTDAWARLARYCSNVPLLGLMRGAPLRLGFGTLLRLAGAAALYGVLVLGHAVLAGVPIPF